MTDNKPLDLRAVEAYLRNGNNYKIEHATWRSDEMLVALLAHCRALRAALEPFLEMGRVEGKFLTQRPDSNTAAIVINLSAFRRAAAGLAQATDA